MRALSIRQPYAAEILRGMKTVEYRSRRTSIVGQRFYIYAAGKVPEQADTAKRLRNWDTQSGDCRRGFWWGRRRFPSR